MTIEEAKKEIFRVIVESTETELEVTEDTRVHQYFLNMIKAAGVKE